MKRPIFTGRNVSIAEIAEATGKNAQLIRVGLQRGIFTFGYAFVNDGCTEYNYYCPDKKVFEEIGYFKGEYSND